MPILRAVRAIRQAISPRLAIRMFLNIEVSSRSEGCFVCSAKKALSACSQRYVRMLALRQLDLLVAKHRQRLADSPPRRMRLNDVVDEAATAGGERVGELRFVAVGPLGDQLGVAQFGAEDDFDRTLGSHDRHLG